MSFHDKAPFIGLLKQSKRLHTVRMQSFAVT
jgi:hypothetical protein